MGKKLIIKGADFSANAIDGHNYIKFHIGGSALNRALYNATIPVGKKVGFANAQMWSKYKMAISIGGRYPNEHYIWDTEYSGEAYILTNVTILTQASQIFVAPIDGSSLTESQLAELNNNTFFVDD